MITANAAIAAAGRSHLGPVLIMPPPVRSQASARPSRANAGPSRANAGPIRANAGPIRANAGPIRTNAGPSRANAGPSRANAGPIRPKAGPIRLKAWPIRRCSQLRKGLTRSAAGSAPHIIQAATVGRGAVSRARIRSRPSPAGSTESPAARSARRSRSSCSRVGYVMDSAPGLPLPPLSPSYVPLQHAAECGHGSGRMTLHGPPANAHGHGDLGLRQVPVVAQYQRLTLARGQRAQRGHHGRALQLGDGALLGTRHVRRRFRRVPVDYNALPQHGAV